eukprot:438968-Prorocentrum_minimum.AAC.2
MPFDAEFTPFDAEFTPFDAEFTPFDAEFAPYDAEFAPFDAEFTTFDAEFTLMSGRTLRTREARCSNSPEETRDTSKVELRGSAGISTARPS